MKNKIYIVEWFRSEGAPYPPGAVWIEEERAYNFTLYSRQATAVTLLLYSESDLFNPQVRVALDYLKNKSGRIWHCRLPLSQVTNARYYAYSVDGPFEPQRGDRFDGQKVLLDPYAREIFFPPNFNRDASRGRGSNAGKAPLAELPSEQPFDWGEDSRPRHANDTVIYEMHVRGFTRRENAGVSTGARGTYTGVVEKIPYLKELGITAVELLPVFQYDPEEGNYWGYMPMGFFAPHHGYSFSQTSAAAVQEFREMVKALHAADIEVILDVVYNHTTEEDENGPTYHFRGIDNSTYYLLEPDMSRYRDDTGTGNVLRSAHPKVRTLILDSMRFWVKEMHVDGFRFDLASIFTRRDDGWISPGSAGGDCRHYRGPTLRRYPSYRGTVGSQQLSTGAQFSRTPVEPMERQIPR